jgi:2-polyprenyl-3-methyl-5-hydroxy-6-metoxy-1,4-benzoquinol methylase
MIGKKMAGLTQKIRNKLHHALVLAPRGHGKPAAKELWDTQYLNGKWEFLGSLDEMARYMIIHGYIHQVSERLGNKRLALLDIGCGHGQLLHYLPPSFFETYLGIDFSKEAIDRACSLSSANAQFLEADMEKWEGHAQFDVIIFNEALYYALEPVKTLLRYKSFLRENGLFIVSMCKQENHYLILSKLHRNFCTLSSVELTADQQQTWKVQLIAPK